MQRSKNHKVDFLVLGSGIAGVRAAIELARAGHVLMLNKGALYESSTEYAQGGIAVVLGEDDEVSLHLHDTLQAGDGLCREEAVRILVEEGPHLIQELIEWGMKFDRNGTKLAFTREGAHSRSRVLHAHGDSTGREILRALMAKAKSLHTIQIQPYAFAVDLLAEGRRVVGTEYLDEKTGMVNQVVASAVLLATGGMGQVYKETTNPAVATGDGVAIAWRAGATLSDMEFVQFHPTALYVQGAPRFLLSEALRGEGAQLRNIDLERFMPRYHEAAELAPRDIVSRAMVMEMHRCKSEFVYLDLTGLDAEHVKKRFPRIYSTCLEYNLDITADLMPVRPAAHYAMGGVATDLDGSTDLAGLFAAGEVAATGVHGANRLASNSLLEGLVYGAQAARAMSGQKTTSAVVRGENPSQMPLTVSNPDETKAVPDVEPILCTVRNLLWEKVGIIRSGKDLSEAVKRLDSLTLPTPASPSRPYYEALNILEVARVIARSALAREESRGAHYRTDYPLKGETTPPRHSFVSRDTALQFSPDPPRVGSAAPRASGR
ncbi:MAG: L-aspartate oxidase [Acidobacteriia bacterium]|nr:L-aspartate oxidase [Terriglobia bacterium]